ncbi:hypothetical protein [Pedobacter gandavensis]|uniref:hypothetical protein n=1 Tax=Pedobacter gandavensis TaxID=2679963 RepID=UPI00292F18AB|nr:hypothetical protein [Pedobacter gandavensis]
MKFQNKYLLYKLLLVVVFAELGCINRNDVYIISKEDSLYKASLKPKNGILVAPPISKYGRHTFLIDSGQSVYFYSFQEPLLGKGVSDDKEPDTIGLMPNHIFKIPAGTERKFFKENVLEQKSQFPWKSIVIASFKDSVKKSDFIQYLIRLRKVEPNKISLQIRLALREEREVLDHKRKGIHYDPEKVRNNEDENE